MRKLIAIIALLCLAILTAMALFKLKFIDGRHVKPKVDVATLEKDIREHLPIGSSRVEVSAFLDQRKIEHTHTGDVASFPEVQHKEIVIIRDVSEKGLVKSDIQILFKFDESDSKLVSYSVREIFTGP